MTYNKRAGRWQATLSLGTVAGKPRRRTWYLPSEQAARDKLALERARQLQGALERQPNRRTVAAYLNEWLADHTPDLKPRTATRYKELLTLHALPYIGSMRLSEVQPRDVQQLYAYMRARGLAPRTIQQFRAVLHAAFKRAELWDEIARNPVARTSPPRVTKTERPAFTPEQAKAFVQAIRGDRLEALYWLAVGTGLRQGEALALRWRDVAWEAATVRLRATLQRYGGAWHLDEPKTSKSARVLYLPPPVVEVLKAHQDRQGWERRNAGDLWEDWGLVFCRENGAPVHARTLEKAFARLLQAHGLPPLTFHGLRHTASSLWSALGVDVRTRMDALGHSQASMTMSYTHSTPELQREAAERMGRLLSEDG